MKIQTIVRLYDPYNYTHLVFGDIVCTHSFYRDKLALIVVKIDVLECYGNISYILICMRIGQQLYRLCIEAFEHFSKSCKNIASTRS